MNTPLETTTPEGREIVKALIEAKSTRLEFSADDFHWIPVNQAVIYWDGNATDSYFFRLTESKQPISLPSSPAKPEPVKEVAPQCPRCKSGSKVWRDDYFGGAWICHRSGCNIVAKHKEPEQKPRLDLSGEIELLRILNTPSILIKCLAKIQDHINQP